MLAGRNYNYKGPRTHDAIVKKILEESKKKRRALNFYKVEKIVRLFFNLKYGLSRYFIKGNNFYVRYVGWFKPNPARRYISIKGKVKKRMKLREGYKIRNRRRDEKKLKTIDP